MKAMQLSFFSEATVITKSTPIAWPVLVTSEPLVTATPEYTLETLLLLRSYLPQKIALVQV